MAGYEINVGAELLPGLLNGPNGLAKLVESVLNQILEAQVTESVCAGRHERSEASVTSAAKSVACLEDGFDDTMALLAGKNEVRQERSKKRDIPN